MPHRRARLESESDARIHVPRASVRAPAHAIFASLAALAELVGPSALGAASPPRFARLSTEHGLSQNTVQAILQDHVGFLWFGTEEGLSRFDGDGVVVFRHDAEKAGSLPNDRVTVLFEDRERRLWVGTDSGLSLFDRRHEIFVPEASIAQRVTGIAQERSGRLWVAAEGDGLFARDPEAGSFVLHQHEAGDPGSFASYLPSDILIDRRGRVWIGTKDSGVERLAPSPLSSPPVESNPAQPSSARFVHYRPDPADPDSIAHHEVWALAEDGSGRIWVATYGGGLDLLDPETGKFRHFRHRSEDPRSVGTDLVTAVFTDRAGTVWVGTDGAGLQRYDAQSDGFVSFRHDARDSGSLSQEVIRSLFEDSQDQLWVGTFLGGVNVLRKARQAFHYFAHDPADPNSLGGPIVNAFLEDSSGRIWVSTSGGWLHEFDLEAESFRRHSVPPPALGVLSFHQDRRGRLWLGTYRGGLFRFDPARGVVGTFGHRPGDAGSLSNDEVWAIAEDGQGGLWLGTNEFLDHFDAERGVVTARYATPAIDWAGNTGVRALLSDREGNLWVGALGGLFRLSGDRRTLERIHPEDRSLGQDGVVALHQDRRGRLWIGTFGGGLKRLDPETGDLETFKGFPSNVIYGVQEAPDGHLWLSTNHGLVRFDPERGGVEAFDLSNGLETLQFSLGASYRTRAGRILFGGVDGFYEFDPGRLRTDRFAPTVVLTAVRLANEPMPVEVAPSSLEEITLSYRDKVFSFEFAALDFTLPKRNQYAYRMSGFSDLWLELGDRREVTFTNLDPGRYRFEVKASNSDGVWNESSTASLGVIVRPPYWGTWWFRTLAVAVFAGVLLGVHRLRLRRLTAHLLERQRVELALRQAQEKYREIFENAVEGIFQTMADGRPVTVNPALASMLGVSSPAELLARAASEGLDGLFRADPERRRELLSLLAEAGEAQGFELAIQRHDGSELWISASVRAVRDAKGAVVRYEGAVQDVTERKRSEERIQFQAYHDSLTGLPNRLLLEDRLTQALARSHRRRGALAAVFLDLDNFKLINDSLGHAAGDRLLQRVGERLIGRVRVDDTVARVGGDEFTLLFTDLAHSDDASRMAEKLLDAFRLPFLVDGHELYVTASLGVALFPTDGEDSDALLRNADAAMYRAKESGRNNYQLCTPDMNARALERMSLERELRRGIGRGEFALVYQPLVSLANGRIVGAEALVRWNHPERGLVLPETFIPVAEESRLIVPLGEWVLETACQQLRAWRDAGFDSLRMLVNLSVRQLQQRDLIGMVDCILERQRVPAEWLELEITESVAMQNVEWIKGVLRALRERGVRLSIDDFGTGQSSLSYLRHFPLSTLKIDRSFVSDIAVDPDDEAIVRAVIALAHSLKLSVVAEGVARVEQLAFLREAGCEEGQGFLFSAPVSAAGLQLLLDADRALV